MFFKKLETFTVGTPDFELGKVAKKYGAFVDNEFQGIWYNEVVCDELEEFKFNLQKDLREHFEVFWLRANTLIPPHTDSGTKCVINFYVATDDCITQFYTAKEGARKFQIEGQTDGCIYQVDDLEYGPAFLAEPGDTYLLDVTKIHSVIPARDGIVHRGVVCLSSSTLSFEEAAEIFS